MEGSALRWWWVGCLCLLFCAGAARGVTAPKARVGVYYRVTVEGVVDKPKCPCHVAMQSKLPDGLNVEEKNGTVEISGLPTKAVAQKTYVFFLQSTVEGLKDAERYGAWSLELEVEDNSPIILPEGAPQHGRATEMPHGVAGKPYDVTLYPITRSAVACAATPSNTTIRGTGSMGFTLPGNPSTQIHLKTNALADVAGGNRLPLAFRCESWAHEVEVEIDVSDQTVQAMVAEGLTGITLSQYKKIFAAYGQSSCQLEYNDCDWRYIALGGLEQSQLAAQDSQTNGLVDLILRAPVDAAHAAVYLQARFLGAPTSSNNNITSAVTDPTGTLTSTALSQIGSAVDYVVGLQFFDTAFGHAGQFTLGGIAAFGATSPVSAASVSTAYVMPVANTPECATLLGKYPQLEAQYGFVRNQVVTTTVTTSTPPPTTTMSAPFCLVNTKAAQTISSAGATTVVDGVGIADLVQSSADRSSLLLKYVAGVRLVERFHTGTTTHCASANASRPDDGPCMRKIVDFTLGQDQAITGGRFHGMVFKSDILLPIKQTGVYFFGTAAIRLRRNTSALLEAPLILTPVPIASTTNTGSSAIAFPSPSVAVVQQQQSDRDFYRIGLALNLDKVLTGLFKQQ